jgi:cytochrome c biogenesis protein CcmG/thiol:disulfide interchange protein DsbE
MHENENTSVKLPDLTAEERPGPQGRRGLSLGSIVLILGILAAIVVVGVQLMNQNAGQPRSGIAPDFSVNLYSGETFTLSEQRGEIVVVNFWGSWCGPCRAEAPLLQAAHEKYADQGVHILGVGFHDTERAARQFIEENNLTYPNGPDTGLRIIERYNVDGAPETFIVEIAAFYIGPFPDDWLDTTLDSLLAGELES